MSHKNKQCLKMQANEIFKKLFCKGRSKHADKVEASKIYDSLSAEEKAKISRTQYVNNSLRDKIYSFQTYRTYAKHNNYFFEYCEKEHNCKTLAQCRQYVDEWLQSRIDKGLSAYTIATEKAALCKLYGEPATNFIATPKRERANITRSRGEAIRDKDFSIAKNKDFIDFCLGTGLRRSEIQNLKGTQLCIGSGGTECIAVVGKGGRYREAPIIGVNKEKIVQRMQSAGSGDVFEKIPSHADIHSYRAEYATAVYNLYARTEIPKEDRYCCQKDMHGVVLDCIAMQKASQALGHDRIDVIASHYLRL